MLNLQAIDHLFHRIGWGLPRRDSSQPGRSRWCLWQRCLCALLAGTFLIGPETLQQTAQAAVSYTNPSTAVWGAGNQTVSYAYDANGSLTRKTTAVSAESDPQTNFLEKVLYDYDLRNRLARLTRLWRSSGNLIADVVEYGYNDEGLRVRELAYRTVNNGPREGEHATTHLFDPANPTGYAQVLEETHSGQPANRRTYTLGDDVIAQTWTSGTSNWFVYDGHGSTRQHANAAGALLSYEVDPDGAGPAPTTNYNAFDYDAYGVALTPLWGPGLYYAGEHFDAAAQNYYLRARWYDPSSGRFTSLDPFAGNNEDPQSLHKYLYCHANPVNNVDPSGKCIDGIVGVMNSLVIRTLLFAMEYGPTIAALVWVATQITAVMLLSTITVLILQDLGVAPSNEYVAEIGAILGYALITELFILSLLPPPGAPSSPPLRGTNDPRVRQAVDVGNRVHYDNLTDPTRYSHEGGPTQLQRRYQDTIFWFAKRGQGGPDVRVIGGRHPSTYPGSNWAGGINRADFKPDTPTGNAMKLSPNTLRIPYDPQTEQIKL